MIAPEKIAEIDLPGILESEGVQLHRSGNGFQYLCPLHSDHDPSGSLYFKDGKWRFKCFGCQAGGDGIDFVRRLHGLDFKAACQFLGIESGSLSRSEKARIKKNKQRRKISDAFKDVELEMIDDLRRMIFMVYRITGRWKTEADMEQGAGWLHCLPDLEGQLQTLMTGPLADRVGLYQRYVAKGYKY